MALILRTNMYIWVVVLYQSGAYTQQNLYFIKVQLIYDTCLVFPLLDMWHMCPFSWFLGTERSQGRGVKVHSPSARSVMVASRFSSGRDGFALGEE